MTVAASPLPLELVEFLCMQRLERMVLFSGDGLLYPAGLLP